MTQHIGRQISLTATYLDNTVEASTMETAIPATITARASDSNIPYCALNLRDFGASKNDGNADGDQYAAIIDSFEWVDVSENVLTDEDVFQQVYAQQGYAILFNPQYNRFLLTRPDLLKVCLLNVPGRLKKTQLITLAGLLRDCPLKLELASDSPVIKGLLSRFSETYLKEKSRVEIISHCCVLLANIAAPGSQDIIQCLLPRFSDASQDIRQAASASFGALVGPNHSSLTNILLPMLNDDSADAKKILEKLTTRGDSAMIRALFLLLNKDTKHHIQHVLEKRAIEGDHIIVQTLFLLLKDQGLHTSLTIFTIVKKLNLKGMNTLRSLLQQWDPLHLHTKIVICITLKKFSPPNSSECIDELLQLMKDEEERVRKMAWDVFRKVTNLSDPAMIKQLLPLVKENNGEIRKAIWTVVYQTAMPSDPDFIKALFLLMNDEEEGIRKPAWAVFYKMTVLGDLKIINGLLPFLKSGHPDVRENTCSVLQNIAMSEHALVFRALSSPLKDKNLTVRSVAWTTLEKLATPGDTVVIEVLCSLLNSEVSHIRSRACDMLEKFATPNDPVVINALLSLLADKKLSGKWSACKALSCVATKGNQAVIDALHFQLNDEDHEIRKIACWGLSQLVQMGDPSIINALLLAFLDENSQVRQAACEAVLLLTIPGNSTIISALPFKDNDVAVREVAWRIFNKLATPGDLDAIKVLFQLLKEKDPEIKKSAWVALKNLVKPGDQNIIDLLCSQLSTEEDEVRRVACLALGWFAVPGDAFIIDELLVLLRDKNDAVRETACWALGKLAMPGDPVIINALLQLSDTDNRVIDAAQNALKVLAPQFMQDVINQSKEYITFLLKEALLHAIFDQNGVELYLNHAKEDIMIYGKTHSAYLQWVRICEEFTNQNNIQWVNECLAEDNIPHNNGTCIIS